MIDAGQMNSNFNAVAACIGSSAANNASNINSGTLGAAFGGTGVSSWTPGGVVYAASTTQLGQDVNNLFWNASSHSLGIGTGNPGFQLDVVGNGHLSGSLFLEQGASVNFKNNVNAFWNALMLDSGNNLQVGSTNFSGQIQFFNNGGIRARIDTSGNFFITGFYGVGSSQISCGNLAGAAASCSVNATNASNISAGTLPFGRLSGAYSIGNLTVSNTFGGGGGNIGLDNGEALLLKDTGGTYRSGIQIDGANNLDIGESGLNGSICFRNTGSPCNAFLDTSGNLNSTHAFNARDSGGNYRRAVAIDGSNAVQLGDSALSGGICFNNNGHNCQSFFDSNGLLTINNGGNYGGFWAVTQHTFVGYDGGALAGIIRVNTTPNASYVSVGDSGQVVVSGSAGGTCSYPGSGNWSCSSDSHAKQDIQALAANLGLSAILKLKPVSYRGGDGATEHFGFVAQDVEKVFPQLVSGPEGEKRLEYDALIAPLVLAVQELVAEVRGAKNARKR